MRNRCTYPLSKAKVRQSWNKYNLYNLSRITTPPYKSRSFFQQKWTAKSSLRAYHGEQVREGQWTRMFTRRLRSVVPMNAEYLAKNDGQVESAGRGSGAETERSRRRPDPTPFMQMTFAPLERRLDTSIFRALFASSARQARQFVVHGAVKVNGKKMKYPGYLLNPGDMFQVDPERVLFATGVPKLPAETAEVEAAEEEQAEAEDDEMNPATQDAKLAEQAQELEDQREPREVLQELLSQTKTILSSPREKLGGKRKEDLRAFQKSVKRTLSRSKTSTILSDSLEAQFLELQNQLRIRREGRESSRPALPSEQAPTQAVNRPNVNSETESSGTSSRLSGSKESADPREASSEVSSPHASTAPSAQSSVTPSSNEFYNTVSDREYNELFSALTQMQENPIDDAKPYATPWVPRDYMSAFAFIPRYLEVNPNICAAVYIRHPVARPGLAEVPTPFAETTGASAFAWYLRRR